jgi:PKD repeat protein
MRCPPVTASGAASRDLEPGPLTYSWKWDASQWTPFSASASATHVYTTRGTYAVQLRVRDQGGLTHLLSRTVTVEAYDTAPVVALN